MSRNVGAAAAAIAAAPARNPRCRWTTGDDCSETCWCVSDGGGVLGIRPRRCCIPHVVSAPRAASHVRLALARSWTTLRLSALPVRVACLIYQPVPSPPPSCPPEPPLCLTSLRTLSITLPTSPRARTPRPAGMRATPRPRTCPKSSATSRSRAAGHTSTAVPTTLGRHRMASPRRHAPGGQHRHGNADPRRTDGTRARECLAVTVLLAPKPPSSERRARPSFPSVRHARCVYYDLFVDTETPKVGARFCCACLCRGPSPSLSSPLASAPLLPSDGSSLCQCRTQGRRFWIILQGMGARCRRRGVPLPPPPHHTTPPSRQPSRAVAPARRGPPHALEGRASSGAPCPVHRRAESHRATSACRRQKAKREAHSMRAWHPPRGPSCHPPLEQGARRPSQSSRPAGHACAVRCPRRWQRSRANHLAGASAHLCRRERGTKARRLPQGRRPTSQAAIPTACTRCWRRTRTRASVP